MFRRMFPGFREQEWFLADPVVGLCLARKSIEMFEHGLNPHRALLYHMQGVSHAKSNVTSSYQRF